MRTEIPVKVNKQLSPIQSNPPLTPPPPLLKGILSGQVPSATSQGQKSQDGAQTFPFVAVVITAGIFARHPHHHGRHWSLMECFPIQWFSFLNKICGSRGPTVQVPHSSE